MLVIVSDLHLTDGTCGKSISTSAFQLFADRLEELAYNASWRAGGRYHPVSEIDVLLLGDILDPLHSTLWVEKADGSPNPVRPWSDVHAPEFAATLAEITSAILKNNAGAACVLKDLAGGRSLRLPPAGSRGLPARFHLRRVPVKVNLHYMVGNHDWYYHVPGADFEAIRSQVREALGLVNSAGPFPHQAGEIDSLRQLLGSYQVHAQHGDLYDPFNYQEQEGRNAASLADAFAVEMINRFPIEAERRLKDELPAGFIEALRELVNVRPALATPLWISSQLSRHGVKKAAQRRLKQVWDELGRGFLALPFVRAADRRFKLDVVDGLQALIGLTERVSFDTLDALVVWVRRHLHADEITLSKFALQEQAFLNHEARFVVYGHTHHHEVVPLDAGPDDAAATSQMYMNAGTWHSYYDLAIHRPEEEKFVSYQVQTYLTFYRDGERGGRCFETWSGSFSD
jgi:hypothetical protein